MSIDTHLKGGDKLVSLNEILNEKYGFKGVFLFEQFCNIAAVGDCCDICTADKVYLNARINSGVLHSIQNFAGGMDEFNSATSGVDIVFDDKDDNGEVVDKATKIDFTDIIAIHSMPGGDPSEAELSSVDMDDGYDIMGKSGRTVRDMISDHYKCSNEEETDKYLRRYLASN